MTRELEYLVDSLKSLSATGRQNRITELTSMRWELITVDNDIAYFRRPARRYLPPAGDRPMRVPGAAWK